MFDAEALRELEARRDNLKESLTHFNRQRHTGKRTFSAERLEEIGATAAKLRGELRAVNRAIAYRRQYLLQTEICPECRAPKLRRNFKTVPQRGRPVCLQCARALTRGTP